MPPRDYGLLGELDGSNAHSVRLRQLAAVQPASWTPSSGVSIASPSRMTGYHTPTTASIHADHDEGHHHASAAPPPPPPPSASTCRHHHRLRHRRGHPPPPPARTAASTASGASAAKGDLPSHRALVGRTLPRARPPSRRQALPASAVSRKAFSKPQAERARAFRSARGRDAARAERASTWCSGAGRAASPGGWVATASITRSGMSKFA